MSSKNSATMKTIGRFRRSLIDSAFALKKKIKRSFEKYPHIYAVIICLLYLFIFQNDFLRAGDSWAEAFYEYVHGAVANGWQGFFFTGIAGYFNFLPKIFAYSYVALGMPLIYRLFFSRSGDYLFDKLRLLHSSRLQ